MTWPGCCTRCLATPGRILATSAVNSSSPHVNELPRGGALPADGLRRSAWTLPPRPEIGRLAVPSLIQLTLQGLLANSCCYGLLETTRIPPMKPPCKISTCPALHKTSSFIITFSLSAGFFPGAVYLPLAVVTAVLSIPCQLFSSGARQRFRYIIYDLSTIHSHRCHHSLL